MRPESHGNTMHDTIFTRKNIWLILAGIVGLVIGYVLLGQGPAQNPLSMNVAPVVLIVVYCVVFPYAILVRSKKERVEDAEHQNKQGV